MKGPQAQLETGRRSTMQARASNKTLTVAFWATTAFFSV
jgi:hypothetical protein